MEETRRPLPPARPPRQRLQEEATKSLSHVQPLGEQEKGLLCLPTAALTGPH